MTDRQGNYDRMDYVDNLWRQTRLVAQAADLAEILHVAAGRQVVGETGWAIRVLKVRPGPYLVPELENSAETSPT